MLQLVGMHRPSSASTTATEAGQRLRGLPRSLAASSLFVLSTLLLTVVVIAMAVGEGVHGRAWSRVAYVSIYLVAALCSLMASVAALRAPDGTEPERRRRALAWLALVAYALVVPAAITAGATMRGAENAASIGYVLNEVIAFGARLGIKHVAQRLHLRATESGGAFRRSGKRGYGFYKEQPRSFEHAAVRTRRRTPGGTDCLIERLRALEIAHETLACTPHAAEFHCLGQDDHPAHE